MRMKLYGDGTYAEIHPDGSWRYFVPSEPNDLGLPECRQREVRQENNFVAGQERSPAEAALVCDQIFRNRQYDFFQQLARR